MATKTITRNINSYNNYGNSLNQLGNVMNGNNDGFIREISDGSTTDVGKFNFSMNTDTAVISKENVITSASISATIKLSPTAALTYGYGSFHFYLGDSSTYKISSNNLKTDKMGEGKITSWSFNQAFSTIPSNYHPTDNGFTLRLELTEGPDSNSAATNFYMTDLKATITYECYARVNFYDQNNNLLYSEVVMGGTSPRFYHPDKKGYYWASNDWMDCSTNEVYTETLPIVDDLDVNYWTSLNNITYSIVFRGNGATSGEMEDQMLIYDTPENLSKNTYERQGYKFVGWSTSPDGAVEYIDEELVENLVHYDTNVYLYAVWEILPDINYDNLFSLSNWANSQSNALNHAGNSLIVNATNNSITISNKMGTDSKDLFTLYGASDDYYLIPVMADTTYRFRFNTSLYHEYQVEVGQFFIFYYHKNAIDIVPSPSLPHTGFRPILPEDTDLSNNGFYTGTFTTPSDCNTIGLRFGLFSETGTITFSNIAIYRELYADIVDSITNYKVRDSISSSYTQYQPIRIGHTFQGWHTYDDWDTILTDNDIKNFISGTSVYSNWETNKYKVILNFNHPLSNDIQEGTILYGSKYSFPSAFPYIESHGYILKGWTQDPEGNGTLIVPGDRCYIPEDHVLYAQWEIKNKKIKINLNNVIRVLSNTSTVKQVFIDKEKTYEI